MKAKGVSQVRGPEAVRAYYDEFADTRMSGYLREENPRLAAALARLLPLVGPESRVLEVGCGVGLVTERIAGVAQRGFVWACDISDGAIAQAQRRTQVDHVAFRTADVLRESDELAAWISEPVQLLVMIDVIEHLPLAEHGRLFRKLRTLVGEDSALFLTFPSPGYQRYLAENEPDELQVIDEIVELPQLVRVAGAAGFTVAHYSLEDVWLSNQYVHCVLRTSVELMPAEEAERLRAAGRDLDALVDAGETTIWVDDDKGGAVVRSRQVLPFLEKGGKYWGRPADDDEAIREFERLRASGAAFIIFAWPAFWWLEHYTGFADHLRSRFRCALDDERLKAFDLRT